MRTGAAQDGFTIAEMIVTLIVMSLFLTMLFQTFFTSESQRLSVSRRAAAEDIASTNLTKFSSKSDLPSVGVPACSNANNPTVNASLLSPANFANAGSAITTGWSAEPITGTLLPSGSGTRQELKILYPQGCASTMPITIISIVTYGSESVRRAALIN